MGKKSIQHKICKSWLLLLLATRNKYSHIILHSYCSIFALTGQLSSGLGRRRSRLLSLEDLGQYKGGGPGGGGATSSATGSVYCCHVFDLIICYDHIILLIPVHLLNVVSEVFNSPSPTPELVVNVTHSFSSRETSLSWWTPPIPRTRPGSQTR